MSRFNLERAIADGIRDLVTRQSLRRSVRIGSGRQPLKPEDAGVVPVSETQVIEKGRR